MITKIRGIVLQVIRHNDRNDVVTLFTEQRGRVAMLVRGGNSKNARMRRARLQPLALIETEVNFKENRDLQFIGDITVPRPWRTIYFNPVKSAIAIFMAEFLNKLLRTREADERMWRYILYSLFHLDTLKENIANFHISFLIGLLPIAGIEPDLDSFRDDRYFDMLGGAFTEDPPFQHRNYLLPDEAGNIPSLLRMNFRNMGCFRFNSERRRRTLDLLVRYYALHLPIGETFNSLDILHEVFS